MKGRRVERGIVAPRWLHVLPRVWIVLFCATGALTACGPGVYLGSTEPATIEVYERARDIKEFSPRKPPSTAYRALSIIPGVNILSGFARLALPEPERTVVSRTVYTEAIRITRIDGEAIALTAKKVEVPFGEHTIEVMYCRYEERRSACSRGMALSFRAEAGVSYRLRRNSKFQIELWSWKGVRMVARSEAKAVVAQDEEDCVKDREREIKNRLRKRRIDRAEAKILRSRAERECYLLVWGAFPAAE